MNGQIMNSQTSTKDMEARPNKKTAESAENILTMKQNQNMHNAVSSISSRESHFYCPRIARVISAEELGTMSKNNVMDRRPIWGINSLTLIISWTQATSKSQK